MKKILITRPLPDIAEKLLRQEGFCVNVNRKPFLSSKEWIVAVKEYDAILSTFADCLDREILQQKERLQAISNYAVGLDNIAIECAKELGILVYHLPDIVTASTADLTLALLLAASRKLFEAREYVQKGLWKYWRCDLFVGDELEGKILGLLGFGRIGRAVAKRAIGFGMQILFSSPTQKTICEEFKGKVAQVSQEKLYSSSDFLSLHLPLTSSTRGMIDLKAMRQMKKRPMLINMSRGAVVKTEDLVIALKEGLIRGAALDVTDPEPLASHPLGSFENCWIVPHIGTATKECRFQMAKKAAESLIAHFKVANLI
jgi:glyoxylate reductase